MRRYNLRSYAAELIPVGKRPNPFVMRQYKQHVESMHKDLYGEHRRRIDVDYLPEKTPAMTKPMQERTDRWHQLMFDPDFIDTIDKYHKVDLSNKDMPTIKIYLYFHANHFFFVMEDHVRKQGWMSHDFNHRDSAVRAWRANRLVWKEVSWNDHFVQKLW